MTDNSGQETGPWIAPIWLMAAIGGLCLVLTGLAWASILTTGSDGARMSKAPPSSDQDGIYLQVLANGSSLRDGDLVTGIAGQSMADWANKLWQPASWRFQFERGETVLYTILRQGKQIEIPVILGAQPISAILSRNWGVLLFTMIFQVLAIFVLIEKPKDPAAQALFIWAMVTSHFYVWSSFLQIGYIVNGFGFWIYNGIVSLLWASSCAAGLHLMLVFPSPLPIVKRFYLLPWILYPLFYSAYIFYQFFSRIIFDNQLSWIGHWNQADSRIVLVSLILSIIVIIRQYRLHNKGADRQKIKWVFYSGLFASGMTMAFYLIPVALGLPQLNVNIVGLLLLPVPLSMAIAIWRYQLFDINLIIRRTIVYGILSLTLGLIFFITTVILQTLSSKILNQNSAISIVVSTLLIAALFNPLRVRIQNSINKRFFRSKYDADQTLARFADKARHETEIESLCGELLAVVQDTVQPEVLGIWLTKKKTD